MTTFTAPRTLAALVAALTLGTFAAVSLAGPGPQYWNKAPSATPAAKTAPAGCASCTDTAQWKISDRGPSGQGVAGASLASRTHGCSSCSGTVVSSAQQTKDTMTRAAACGTMVCCK